MSKTDIKSLTLDELKTEIKAIGLPQYRAVQIYEWLQKGISQFDKMTNLPKSLIELLEDKFYIPGLSICSKFTSALDGTVKYLFELDDGNIIETVLMSYKHGYSVCISSQVGCRMGCVFCASAEHGFIRNLSGAEMTGQVEAVAKDSGKRISNIVVMGIGEPLDNFDNLINFIYNVNNPLGLGIGQRHISVSTCGLCDRIIQLADMGLQVTLSVSLHAPDDETRDKIMPVNKKYNTAALMEACRYYFSKTGRRISFEYTLIKGLNDSVGHAVKLAALLEGTRSHVNLIPVNSVTDRAYRSTNRAATERFKEILISKGINSTVRRTLGSDISASCGQLKRSIKDRTNKD